MIPDSPNYATYTERQLKQVLRSIDRSRFPERFVAAERSLSVLEAAKSRKAPNELGRVISVMPSKFEWKLVLGGGVLISFGFLIAAIVSTGYPDYFAGVVIGILGTTLGYAHLQRLRLTVFDCGVGIAVQDDKLQCFIELHHIERIEIGGSESANTVILHLAFESPFGELIEFRTKADLTQFKSEMDVRIAKAKSDYVSSSC